METILIFVRDFSKGSYVNDKAESALPDYAQAM